MAEAEEEEKEEKSEANKLVVEAFLCCCWREMNIGEKVQPATHFIIQISHDTGGRESEMNE